MKLRTENGRVPCLVVAGKDVVVSSMTESYARSLIENAQTKLHTGDHKGYPLLVDGTYYFPEIPEPATEEAPAPSAPPAKKTPKKR